MPLEHTQLYSLKDQINDLGIALSEALYQSSIWQKNCDLLDKINRNLGKEIDALNEDIDSLESLINKMKEVNKQLQGDIKTLYDVIDSKEDDIYNLMQKV